MKFPWSTHPYIRTHEGWLYLAVVIDLFSRLVVGWSMKSRITADLVLDASFLKHHNLESSMSRRLAQYTAQAMTMLLQKASSSY